MKNPAPLDFKTIDADKVKETVQAIEEAIKDKEVSESTTSIYFINQVY